MKHMFSCEPVKIACGHPGCDVKLLNHGKRFMHLFVSQKMKSFPHLIGGHRGICKFRLEKCEVCDELFPFTELPTL